MDSIIDKLIDDVQAHVFDSCARIAEIQSLRIVTDDFDRGYDAACKEIAAQIRRLKKGKV